MSNNDTDILKTGPYNRTQLGVQPISGINTDTYVDITVPLNNKPSKYDFLFITVGYYNTGYPSIGHIFLSSKLFNGTENVDFRCRDFNDTYKIDVFIVSEDYTIESTSIKFRIIGVDPGFARFISIWGLRK